MVEWLRSVGRGCQLEVVVMQTVPLGEVVVFESRLWVKVGVPWEAEEVDLIRELQVDYKRIQHSSALSPT